MFVFTIVDAMSWSFTRVQLGIQKGPRMNEFSRKITVTFSVVLTLIGMGLSIGAIMTPSWQVVNLREYGSIHEHGLWLDCTRHSRDGTALLRR